MYAGGIKHTALGGNVGFEIVWTVALGVAMFSLALLVLTICLTGAAVILVAAKRGLTQAARETHKQQRKEV